MNPETVDSRRVGAETVAMSLSYLFLLLPHHSARSVNSPLSPSTTPSLSFTPSSKLTSFTDLSHYRLSSGARTDSTDFMTGPFLLSISVVFSFFIILFRFFGSVRRIELATRQLLGACKYSVSYRIVLHRIVTNAPYAFSRP